MSELDDVIAANARRRERQAQDRDEATQAARTAADPEAVAAQKRADEEKRAELERLGVQFQEPTP